MEQNLHGFGLQAEERGWNSGGGIGEDGQRGGLTPVLLKGCVGFNLVGWESFGPKWTGYVTGFSFGFWIWIEIKTKGPVWF